MVGNGLKWIAIVKKTSEMVLGDMGGWGVVGSGRKWSEVVGSGQKLSKMVSNGRKWSEMVGSGRKWSEVGCYSKKTQKWF